MHYKIQKKNVGNNSLNISIMESREAYFISYFIHIHKHTHMHYYVAEFAMSRFSVVNDSVWFRAAVRLACYSHWFEVAQINL